MDVEGRSSDLGVFLDELEIEPDLDARIEELSIRSGRSIQETIQELIICSDPMNRPRRSSAIDQQTAEPRAWAHSRRCRCTCSRMRSSAAPSPACWARRNSPANGQPKTRSNA